MWFGARREDTEAAKQVRRDFKFIYLKTKCALINIQINVPKSAEEDECSSVEGEVEET